MYFKQFQVYKKSDDVYVYTLYFYYKNIEIIHELFHSAPTIKKYYQSLTGTFNATKSTMTEDTENRKRNSYLLCGGI